MKIHIYDDTIPTIEDICDTDYERLHGILEVHTSDLVELSENHPHPDETDITTTPSEE